MIADWLKAPPFTHIETVVEIQAAGLLGLAVLVLGLLIYRNRRAVTIEEQRTAFADAIVGEMLSFLEHGDAGRQIPHLKFFEFRKRSVLKTVFLEHFNSVSGPEKIFLAGRYDELYFTLEDYTDTHSFIWWRRLQAVSNLSLIGLDEYGSILERMTHDRNGLVSATAFLALSGLASDLNKPRLLSELPPSVLERKNLLFEILRHWSLRYGAGPIIEQIRATKDPALLAILLPAASSLQTPEIGDVYAELIRDSSNLAPEVIQEMLGLLRKVGDPAWIEAVRPFLNYKQEGVRLRAMEYMVAIGEIDILYSPSVEADTSAIVQRWRQAQLALLKMEAGAAA